MKLIRFILISIIVSCFISAYASSGTVKTTAPVEPQEKLAYTNSGISGKYPALSPAAVHGKLRVIGTQLCDEKGAPLQLRGFSTHGVQWYGRFINKDGIAWLVKNWKMDVLRVALYTLDKGYIIDPALEYFVKDAVRYTETNGIYCIIDWHVLGDKDPNIFIKKSMDFFKRMAFQYGAKKHVMYEICNEPNGAEVHWSDKIKPYAETVIPVIRAGDSNAVIIVGTGSWSQDVQDAAADPLKYDNIMYTFHFYAGSHTQWLRDRVKDVLPKIAVFCTEWGTSDSSGNNGPFLAEAKKWVDFMNDNKISWCNWSLSDKQETSAALKPDAVSGGGWTDDKLSESGKFVRDQMKDR